MSLRFSKVFYNIIRGVSTKPTTNGEIQPRIFNRNPRNLEKLRIKSKPKGYPTEDIFIEYWHKLEVFPQSRYVIAQLIHNSQKVVIEASTKEWAIQKQLYSLKDKQAYIILAKIFAERCLESGFTSFYLSQDNLSKESNIYAFANILKEEGITLEEPTTYNAYDMWRTPPEKKPWTVLED